MKVFETGIIVGRFQHIHNGHEKIITIGRNLCDKLLIFVGSYESPKTIRNPYEYEYRKELIYKIYKNQIQEGSIIVKPLKDLDDPNELSFKWGEYVIENATNVLSKKPQCIIYGKDKDIFKCFSKETVKNITEVLVDRNSIGISATKMREYILNDMEDEWKKYANPLIYNEYSKLKSKLELVVNSKN